MGSFYFEPTFKKVYGTSPYMIQKTPAEQQSKVESAQPQIAPVVEETPQFHSRDDMPKLDVDLNTVRVKATHDILEELDSRVKPKKGKGRKKK